DLFDYGSGENIGKPTGIDIKERKMTLPLIYALQKASSSQKSKMLRIIRKHNENPRKVQEVIDFVLSTDGIDYAHSQMMDYRQKALDVLNTFEDSEAKESLAGLVEYTINRTK
ncbi:MAG: polyprenyl synthetase family protein, partial [Flavobacteriales bacterium]